MPVTDEDHENTTPRQEALWTLLGWLCTEWGFCLDFADAEAIAYTPGIQAQAFAAAVLNANGHAPDDEYGKKIAQRFHDQIDQRA
jgi:hypothetical protein